MTDEVGRTYQRDPAVLWADAVIATVVLTGSDDILRLDGIGSWVWNEIAESVSTGELALRAVETFEVEVEVARTDIQAFLDDLDTQHLLA